MKTITEIALVNTNRIKPPIGPIGLEYVGETLDSAGHNIKILDLCWSDDSDSKIASFFEKAKFDLIGVTLRVTDDCAFTSQQSFLDDFIQIVNSIKKHTNALIVLGGVGFSVMPEKVLNLSGADLGVWGGGEFAFVELANKIEKNQDWSDAPNLIWQKNGEWHHNPRSEKSLADLPVMSRDLFNNRRYFKEGGQAGIETKRGCNRECIYCADPLAKGNEIKIRPPEEVVDEIENLLEQGIDYFHTCDSEFNLLEWHASEVCKEIISRGIEDEIQWYAYCSPNPFSSELAGLMSRAGCVGIDFGVDNGDEEMLKRLKRGFTPDDILSVANSCREVGITTMFDLLLGSPGETRKSIEKTIELMKEAEPNRIESESLSACEFILELS